jgi:hypothetical protein
MNLDSIILENETTSRIHVVVDDFAGVKECHSDNDVYQYR